MICLPVEATDEAAEGTVAPPAKPADAEPDLAALYALGDAATDTFSLRNWRLDAGTLQALKACLPACPSVTTLRFSGCGLSAGTVAELAGLVKSCPKVITLAIEFNFSSSGGGAESKDEAEETKADAPADAHSFAALIDTTLPLKTLSLRGNDLGDAAMAVLAPKLRTNASITSLNLAGNHISAAGLAYLAPAFRDNRCLLDVSLASNDLEPAAYVCSCCEVFVCGFSRRPQRTMLLP